MISQTVHLVDDDPQMLTFYEAVFGRMGLTPRSYSTGLQFLDAITRGESGCVLLDLILPDIDGLAVIERLRTKGIELPVIAVSGQATVSAAVRAMRAGAVAVLEKPCSLAALRGEVTDALALDRDRRQRVRARDDAAERLAALTAKERQVLDIALTGATNKAIAYRLNLGIRTVERHRANALEKLRVRTLFEAAQLRASVAEVNTPRVAADRVKVAS